MSDLELDPRVTTPLRSEWHPRARYLGLPKEFGAVSTEVLEELADRLERSGSAEDLECAASALIEATIFSPDRSLDSVDTDIATIDYAEELLKQAAERHWRDLEMCRYHHDDQSRPIRAETQLACIELYRDIIGGEITHQTRSEVFKKLAYWCRYTYRLGEIAEEYRTGAIGLTSEIVVLLGGLTENDGILLPATPREDNGERGDWSLSHDFNYLAFDSDGTIGMNVGIELKRLEDMSDRIHAEDRYDTDRIVLIQAHDLGIHEGSMRRTFSNLHDFSPSSRLALRPVREGLYQKIATSVLDWEQKKGGISNIAQRPKVAELPLAS